MIESVKIKNDFMLNGQSRIPYYFQLKQYFLKMIESGLWKQGQMLPSESQLCTELSISRIVVRQALQELKSEGYVISRKGKGSFVAEPKFNENWIQSFMGFNENMAKLGYKVFNDVIRQEKITAPEKIAEILQLKQDSEVIVIERVHNINDEPFYLSINYIPYKMFPDLLEQDLKYSSLYKTLENKYGVEITHSRRYIDIGRANAREAVFLKIEKGEPVFKVESISYLKGEIPFEYFNSVHLGGRSRFVVELIKTDFSGKSPNISLDSISSGVFIKPYKQVKKPEEKI